MNLHQAGKISLPVTAALFVAVLAIIAIRADAQAEVVTDTGPGAPKWIQPAQERIDSFRGADLAQQEAVLGEAIACIRDRGYDAYEVPGAGLRRGNLEVRVFDENLEAFNAIMAGCTSSTGLDALELAVAQDMREAPEEAKATSLAVYDACIRGAAPSEDDMQVQGTCARAAQEQTGLVP